MKKKEEGTGPSFLLKEDDQNVPKFISHKYPQSRCQEHTPSFEMVGYRLWEKMIHDRPAATSHATEASRGTLPAAYVVLILPILPLALSKTSNLLLLNWLDFTLVDTRHAAFFNSYGNESSGR
ncbi:hypothetical protein NC653_012018 [Populus alba x Populus x berolinensis]|uniref:Uncharacterized protein n=1 Tax=Populus alba x Populus x berolinensis TaxID=444605 RepID=A0AAD6R3P5_9ROSI|nr:hypothetical protein NC653_012018 [Populus alba x Populus x berolinensis]